MEVTQFTYFQQVGGFDCKPVSGELTYGLERLAMYIQGVDNVFDLKFNDAGVTYGDVFLENEKRDVGATISRSPTPRACSTCSSKAAAEAENCLDDKLPIPAYEQAIKASHIFNTLQARGVISVAERQAYIGRVRDLAKAACARGWKPRGGGVSVDFLLELLSRGNPGADAGDGAQRPGADVRRGAGERRGSAGGDRRLVDAAAAGADRARAAAANRGGQRGDEGPAHAVRRRRRSKASCARRADAGAARGARRRAGSR